MLTDTGANPQPSQEGNGDPCEALAEPGKAGQGMEGKRSPAAQSQREQGSKCAGKVVSAPSRSLRSQRIQWGVGRGQGGGKIKLWGECVAGHPRDRQGWSGLALLPSAGWGPPWSVAISPSHDRRGLFRDGEAAGHLRWHRSTTGMLSGQEGSGARGDFADPFFLQDLEEI